MLWHLRAKQLRVPSLISPPAVAAGLKSKIQPQKMFYYYYSILFALILLLIVNVMIVQINCNDNTTTTNNNKQYLRLDQSFIETRQNRLLSFNTQDNGDISVSTLILCLECKNILSVW